MSLFCLERTVCRGWGWDGQLHEDMRLGIVFIRKVLKLLFSLLGNGGN